MEFIYPQITPIIADEKICVNLRNLRMKTLNFEL